MKYKLILDKTREEEITVVAHAPSSLTQQLEDLVRNYTGTEYIMGYREDELRKLPFSGIDLGKLSFQRFLLRHKLLGSALVKGFNIV